MVKGRPNWQQNGRYTLKLNILLSRLKAPAAATPATVLASTAFF